MSATISGTSSDLIKKYTRPVYFLKNENGNVLIVYKSPEKTKTISAFILLKYCLYCTQCLCRELNVIPKHFLHLLGLVKLTLPTALSAKHKLSQQLASVLLFIRGAAATITFGVTKQNTPHLVYCITVGEGPEGLTK